MPKNIPLVLFLVLIAVTIIISIFFAYSKSRPVAAPVINTPASDDSRINLIIPSNPKSPVK